jgi:glycosyltransferase involved in cell wall biosynthesis
MSLRRVKSAAATVRRYYAANGAAATAKKIASRLVTGSRVVGKVRAAVVDATADVRKMRYANYRFGAPNQDVAGIAVFGACSVADAWVKAASQAGIGVTALPLDLVNAPAASRHQAVLLGEEYLASHSSTQKKLLAAFWGCGVPVIAAVPDAVLRTAIDRGGYTVSDASRAGKEDLSAELFGTLEALRGCDFVWCESEVAGNESSFDGLNFQNKRTLPQLCETYRRRRLPKVTIIGILYRKRDEVAEVLACYAGQDYPGEIEVLWVNDCTPDDSVIVAENAHANLVRAGQWPSRYSFRVIHNTTNSGNCVSRNIAIGQAQGDLLIVIDADCAVNKTFVSTHVAAHATSDADVVLGPMNIESGGARVAALMAELDGKPERAMAMAKLQDAKNPPSFTNCITRNFSASNAYLTQVLKEPLFDPLFGYSADPQSGFGWEDVEAGYRLYKAGARFKFASNALSVHVSPEVISDDVTRPGRSMLNFRRLHEKHPEMCGVARAWSTKTFADICAWADERKAICEPNRDWLNAHLRQGKSQVFNIRQPRPLRVLTYRWHVPHQYELYKLPFEFTLLTGLGTGWTESWDFEQRPLPANVRFAHVADVRSADFDFALLHFDENVLRPDLTNGVLDGSWGKPFRYLLEQVDLPKVAICHGTPQFHGQYTPGYEGPDLMQPIEESRAELVRRLSGVSVVCNSYQAEREWGFHDSRTIWHGFDPADYPPATYKRGILSPLGALVLSRPHYRGYYLYRQVMDGHFAQLQPDRLRVQMPHHSYEKDSAAYAWAKYRSYIDTLRQYSVYFNPTLRSPMPRARSEPMMCGVVTVNASNHDVELFIRNGENGFHSNDPDELRDFLYFLSRDSAACRKIGASARQTALKEFNQDRFVGTWLQLARSIA